MYKHNSKNMTMGECVMKIKLKLLVCVVLVLILAMPTISATQSKQFKDVSSTHWAKKEIDYLVNKSIITGYSNGNYGVNDPVTRAQVASMIMRSYGWEGEWENPGYADLKNTHWAYNSIAALYHLDIFKPTGNYNPEQPMTRAEMAQVLVNAFQLSSIKAQAYTDVSPSHPYYEAINILSGSQVTTGYPDGTYKPNAPVTRAEFAVFMTRAYDEAYRLIESKYADTEGVIYDLQVGQQYYRLNNPILLFDVWMAPIELFEKMGYVVQELGENHISLNSIEHGKLQLKVGEKKLWVGDTSVELDAPLMKYNGQFYIESHPIVSALDMPLVFYPSQFLIALEAPQISPTQIMNISPSTALDIVHTRLPYWHWTKKDKDYLELISIRNQVDMKSSTLLAEMKQLTEKYKQIEAEIEHINGINYVSDHVSGKLDAVSRAIEARYNLVTNKQYDYPQIGKSGGLGSLGQSTSYTYDYLVYDHVFEHLDVNKQHIIHTLKENKTIDFNLFNGLFAFGIPFSIQEQSDSGTASTWAGLASGSQTMFVVHSHIDTFYHELGHNWDAMLGDDNEYLKIRNQSAYTAKSQEWANRVNENFAEDFAIAFMPEASLEHHSGVFGAPTKLQIENLRKWVTEKSQSYVKDSKQVKLNNLSIVPDVIALSGDTFKLEGNVLDKVEVKLVNVATGQHFVETVPNLSNEYEIRLPAKGIYKLTVYNINTTIVYQ